MTNTDLWAKGLGALATTMFLGALAVYLYRFFAGAHDCDRLMLKSAVQGRACTRTVLLTVALAFLISRLLMYLGGALWAWREGMLSIYLRIPEHFWTRWDAPHYVGLIENWYGNTGDARLHIVFLPLFPAIGRVFHLATGLSPLLSGYLVSNAACFGCGIVMFRLVELAQGARGGMRAAVLFLLSPLTLFCSLPYTESVFLLTTLLAVYLARKRQFFWAVVFGALSANARIPGMATAVPIFYELLRAQKGGILRRYALSALKVLPVSLGLVAYLWLNYAVTGDAMRFQTYQSEHWGQTFGSLYNTVGYTFRNAVAYHDFGYRIGVWIPQLIAIFLVLAILIAVIRRAHPGDQGYAMIYFYASVAPTWLLSGPRYLTALYALYPALALLAHRRAVFYPLALLSTALCVIAGAMYAGIGCIL
ncbi:MAG: mannosyltransferase family protein [Christensenellales bacterium]